MKLYEQTAINISDSESPTSNIGIFQINYTDNDTASITDGVTVVKTMPQGLIPVDISQLGMAKFILIKVSEDVTLTLDSISLNILKGKYNKIWTNFSQITIDFLTANTKIVMFIGK